MTDGSHLLEALGIDLKTTHVRSAVLRLGVNHVPTLDLEVALFDLAPIDGEVVREFRRYELVERTEETE